MNFANDLGFSLCAVLSVCHKVATLEEQIKFKRVSSDKKYITVKYQSLVFNDIHYQAEEYSISTSS